MKTPLASFIILSIATIVADAQSTQTDKDGNIPREEFVRFWDGQFARLDCSEVLDGKLTSSEWKNPAFFECDRNVDGFVDKEEWTAGRLADFDRSDVNLNGVLEPSESNPNNK